MTNIENNQFPHDQPGQLPENDTQSPYTVILEPGGFFLENSGKRVNIADRGHLPNELFSLVDCFQLPVFYSVQYLFRYLKRVENDHPLFWQNGEIRVPLYWAPFTPIRLKTIFNLQNNEISIERTCIVEGQQTDHFYLWGDQLIIDLDNNMIIPAPGRDGWVLWNYYHQILTRQSFWDGDDFANGPDQDDKTAGHISENNKLVFTLSEFQEIQFNYNVKGQNTALGTVEFKIDHQDVIPRQSKYNHTLTISPDPESPDFFILAAECALGSFRTGVSGLTFNFLSYINQLTGYSCTKKRKKVICQTLVDLFGQKSIHKGKKIIIQNISPVNDFVKHEPSMEVKGLLADFHKRYLIEEEQLQCAGGEWLKITRDKHKEASLFTIPYSLFGWIIFDGMENHTNMRVAKKDLMNKLAILYRQCREQDIALLWEHQPITGAHWDVEFTATKSKGIDWFEIKPQIQCDGTAVSPKEWESALKHQGLIITENGILLLDEHTQNTLNMFSQLTGVDDGGKDKTRREILKVPRLQVLDWIYLRRQGIKLNLPPAEEKIIDRLINFSGLEEIPLPVKLKAKLRPYQREGYQWLCFLYESRFGACLADDMGLGKTLQAIALMAGLKEGLIQTDKISARAPHLLIVPPSLLFNWEHEISRFYPGLKVYQYTGKDRQIDFKDYDVILTTYGIIRRDIAALKTIEFNLIIFDEAQSVKNILAHSTAAVRQLCCRFKLALTGTPLENHLGEYYSIMDLCLPGLLGGYDQFKSQLKHDESPALNRIIQRTKPFVLRRTKENVLKELPKKMEIDVYLELTEKQKAMYHHTVDMIRDQVSKAYAAKTRYQAQIIALTAILKLRQICVSTKLLEPNISDHSPKIDFLISKLQELHEEGHSALVFSQFTSFLNILEPELKKHHLSFLRLDGSTPVTRRKKLIETFQEAEGPSIFLLSLKAGGQGLNLTKASYVFHLDPWWNPAVENQASDRAHRIGQKKKVSVMRLLMRHTIEEKMMDLKKKKSALYDAVLGETIQKTKSAAVTREDFEFLLG
ncbi:MAG: DEAD/DEAH box helicase [Candidatus Margulisiibacteriota bacterium]